MLRSRRCAPNLLVEKVKTILSHILRQSKVSLASLAEVVFMATNCLCIGAIVFPIIPEC